MEDLKAISKQEIIESFIELEELGDKLCNESEGTSEFNKLNNRYEYLYNNILYNICLINFNFGTSLYYKDNQDKLINNFIEKFSLYEPYEDDKYFHLVSTQDDFKYYQYKTSSIYIKLDVKYIDDRFFDIDGYEQSIDIIEAGFKDVRKVGEKTIPVFNE